MTLINVATQSMFVYGTLRLDMDYREITPLSGVPIGLGEARGQMYSLGGFPGVVPHATETVTGQLISYEHHDDAQWDNILEAIDFYEGSMYRRQLTPITMHDGEVTEAWMYFPTNPGEIINATWTTLIPHGDWKLWKEENR